MMRRDAATAPTMGRRMPPARSRRLCRAGTGAARVQDKIVGGLHFPGDESGDCFQFTQSLANLAKSRGVTFSLNTHIERLETDGDNLIRVITGEGELTADAFVIACGSYTPLLRVRSASGCRSIPSKVTPSRCHSAMPRRPRPAA